MSTRTNVVVRFGKTRVWLYRHHDGYPAECGAAIVEAIRKVGNRSQSTGPAFLSALVGLRYDDGREIYEFTDDYHGDIEHVYDVLFVAGEIKIRHAVRPRSYPDVDTWADKGEVYNLSAFVALVNRDRAEINRRLAELRHKNGMYKDCEDYPMLEAEAA